MQWAVIGGLGLSILLMASSKLAGVGELFLPGLAVGVVAVLGSIVDTVLRWHEKHARKDDRHLDRRH
jgi:hypothetical protein